MDCISFSYSSFTNHSDIKRIKPKPRLFKHSTLISGAIRALSSVRRRWRESKCDVCTQVFQRLQWAVEGKVSIIGRVHPEAGIFFKVGCSRKDAYQRWGEGPHGGHQSLTHSTHYSPATLHIGSSTHYHTTIITSLEGLMLKLKL